MIDATLDHRSEPRRALVADAQPADEAAAGLIRRHWPSVRRYLRILGAEPAAADDLAQDVFVVALRRGLEDRGGSTAAWLRRTARFLFLDHRRRRRPVSLEAAEAVWQEHDEQDERDVARRRALRACLSLLTERNQTALRLAYGERRSWTQIGHALGMQASGVKTLLRRCRATLRECIERAMTNGPEDNQ